MSELLSIREYARRRGVSHVAVMKAAKNGRIKLVNGKVDPETANRDWPANTNEAQKLRKAAIDAGMQLDEGGAPPGGAGTNSVQKGVANGSAKAEIGVNYAHQRAIREGYLARLAKIDYEIKTGKLVEADKIRVKVFNLARRARDMMLALPDRLSPILAGEQNQFECHRILAEEIRRVCDEISSARPV